MHILKPEQLPQHAKVHRVILHWTGGSNKISMLDKAHYHFIVSGDLEVRAGVAKPGIWLPHTRNLNTNSVGVSLAGMAGAIESPFNDGNFPINEDQYHLAAKVVADICSRYDLDIRPKTVLCHQEVTYVYGPLANPPGPERFRQRGKWDVSVLPWQPSKVKTQVWADWRTKVAMYLDYAGAKG